MCHLCRQGPWDHPVESRSPPPPAPPLSFSLDLPYLISFTPLFSICNDHVHFFAFLLNVFSPHPLSQEGVINEGRDPGLSYVLLSLGARKVPTHEFILGMN